MSRILRSGQVVGVASLSALTLALASPVNAADAADDQLEEVLVTAQRHQQNIMDVPLSVTSYSPEQLSEQGVHQIDDLARLTPSLHFSRTSGVSGNNGSDISIRGIASDVGSSTTAIYIDDTPIQIRSIGYFGGNAYPIVFDLERIEVLRGPQGTLFGSGAEGGAVRFLTPQPDFEKSSLYARTEFATTENGSASYEAGVAAGTPISSTLALRGSLWYRHDGGYIDRYDQTMTTLVEKDVNDADNYSGKLALGWKPTDDLTVTPSIYYQKVDSGARPQYWESQSDVSGVDYRTGTYNNEPSQDKFYLPAVKIEYDFGKMDLISNTSYFRRDRSQDLDYSTYLTALRTGDPFGTYSNEDLSNAVATQTLQQRNFVQEVRLQSISTEQPVDWTTGLFYSNTQQDSTNLSGSGRVPGTLSRGYEQYLGRYNLYDNIEAKDVQYAGFGSVDYKATQALTVTAGLRVSRNEFNYTEIMDGPVNSGVRTTSLGAQDENAVTPKFGVSYHLDGDNMVYASASKGFRPGGAQSPVDAEFCATDLATLGLTASPRSYDSDSLWSYEVGSKNRLLGGALTVDANAYYTKWNNIQQSIRLPTCSFSFIANLGKATGKGADVSVVVKPLTALQLGASLGYNTTTYDDDVIGGNGLIIKEAGDRIGGPKWTGAVFGLGETALTANYSGYLRVDYSFQSSGIPQNPEDFGYDSGLSTLPATNLLSARVGVKFSAFDVSLFANNITDSNEALSRSHDTTSSPLYYVQSYQPRTIGVTAQMRF